MIKNIAIILLIFLGFSASFAGDMNYARTDGKMKFSINKDQTFDYAGIQGVYELQPQNGCPIKLYSPTGKYCCISIEQVGPKFLVKTKSKGTGMYSEIGPICAGGVFDKVK